MIQGWGNQKRSTVFALFFGFGILLGGFRQLFADSWRSQQFLESLSDSPYDVRVLKEGLGAVNDIWKWADEDARSAGAALYYPALKLMRIADNAFDDQGRLSSWKELSPMQLDSIAHEALHSYLRSDALSDEGRAQAWIELRAAKLFPGNPKGRALLEEAYGWYLGRIFWQHSQISQQLQDFCRMKYRTTMLSRLRLLKQSWVNLENEEVTAARLRNGRIEWLYDTFLYPILGRWDSREGVTQVGREEMYDTSIERVDKVWIRMAFLGNKMSRSFEEAFAGPLKNAEACIAKAAPKRTLLTASLQN